jgi:hypothetical protein
MNNRQKCAVTVPANYGIEAERDESRRAAERAGVPLSEWIRDRLTKGNRQ